MRRFVEGIDRGQATLLPECLADWIDENNPVRVIDAFVDKLDLSRLGFEGVAPEATGRLAAEHHVQELRHGEPPRHLLEVGDGFGRLDKGHIRAGFDIAAGPIDGGLEPLDPRRRRSWQ